MVSTKLGKAKVDITPPFAIPLAGYASRKMACTGTSSRLSLRVWLFVQEDDSGRLCQKLLVQGDIIWWGSERMEELCKKLKARWGIERSDMLFHASHTHGGPQTSNQFSPLLGQFRSEYVDFLEIKVEEAVAKAQMNLEPVTIELGIGTCEGISINRRLQSNGVTVMAPNPDGVNDPTVTVIRFMSADLRIIGILFHFTCHPTTTDANLITSDYCGMAMEALDKVLGDGVSCFLQGFCGDIRPALYKDNKFYSGDHYDVVRNGEVLAETVLNILEQPMETLKPAKLVSWTKQVELHFKHILKDDELMPHEDDDELTAGWKQQILAKPAQLRQSVPLHMQLVQIAEKLAFLAIDGEIVVEYGLWAKSLSNGTVLPVGYSNGMLGYIPTAQQILEGGYESKDSTMVFGYSSSFALEVESVIRRGIEELIDQMQHNERSEQLG
ncbi:hypothetical protein GC102_06070 [Paenibacillus sp. LMG 31460]|uniref:Neutral ceramidase n=1 Tax=Paenibacillus germinis TaxID=2654979 RepID=A0ABX1YXS2_9BACL|nr:neutral/alkaline non-lysosomal ceramidase N-terminal domain-containing protein [Paenibacillus germinis]NOU85349.1 hypothetical protein [Paenibacillus germinis]